MEPGDSEPSAGPLICVGGQKRFMATDSMPSTMHQDLPTTYPMLSSKNSAEVYPAARAYGEAVAEEQKAEAQVSTDSSGSHLAVIEISDDDDV